MNLISSPSVMQRVALELRAAGKTIGLVPTMGYLHEGHASLMRLARQRAETLVVSIFVNPAQFGPNEDFGRYPRDFKRDEKICLDEKTDFLFYPQAADIYLPDHSVYVAEEKLSAGLCGARRPGHFRGVATVVAKLFNIVLPHIAVFGEKDGQQLRVIRRMTRDLNFPVEIVPGLTLREADGLAMSSRNVYLSPDERAQALCLKKALDCARDLFEKGERDADKLRAAMRAVIDRAPAARIDYIELADDETLTPVETLSRPCLAALAVFVGKTRLIDNTVLVP